jgi:hypothetical protein
VDTISAVIDSNIQNHQRQPSGRGGQRGRGRRS